LKSLCYDAWSEKHQNNMYSFLRYFNGCDVGGLLHIQVNTAPSSVTARKGWNAQTIFFCMVIVFTSKEKHLPYVPHSLTLFELSQSVYLCVLYDSHSKEQLFPFTVVVGWPF